MIILNTHYFTGWGCNGIYWRFNKTTGVKLSIETDKETRNEGNFLKKLNRFVPGVFPEFKGFMYAKVDDEKALLYKMEHIEGKNADSSDLTRHQLKQLNQIRKELKHAGIEFKDLEGNMIIQKDGVLRLIDADPHYFKLTKKKSN